MPSELMPLFSLVYERLSFCCHKIILPAEIGFIVQHLCSKEMAPGLPKSEEPRGDHLAGAILGALRFGFTALGIFYLFIYFFTSCLGTFYHPPLSCSEQLPFILSSSSSLWQ